MANGDPFECDPDSEAYCCNPNVSGGFCGKGASFCGCPNCIDYSSRRHRLEEEEEYSSAQDHDYDYVYDDSESNRIRSPTERMASGQMLTYQNRNRNRKLASSQEPGFSLHTSNSPVGVCLNAFSDQKQGQEYKAFNIDLCTSNLMQGWELTEEGFMRNMMVSAKPRVCGARQTIKSLGANLILTTSSIVHYFFVLYMYLQWPDHCVSAKKSDMDGSLVGTKLHVVECTNTLYKPLIWQLPDFEYKLLSSLTPHSRTNVDTVINEPCYFLANPKSENFAPTEINLDNHKVRNKNSSTNIIYLRTQYICHSLSKC